MTIDNSNLNLSDIIPRTASTAVAPTVEGSHPVLEILELITKIFSFACGSLKDAATFFQVCKTWNQPVEFFSHSKIPIVLRNLSGVKSDRFVKTWIQSNQEVTSITLSNSIISDANLALLLAKCPKIQLLSLVRRKW